MNTTPPCFDHEKLVAYQRSLQFVAWSSQLLEELAPKSAKLLVGLIKSIDPDLPVVMLTGDEKADTAVRALRSGRGKCSGTEKRRPES